MPKMDDYELARRLCELSGGKHVPLIALTGFARHNDVQRALKSGFDAHIETAFDRLLTATMRRPLSERSKEGKSR